MTHEGKQMGGEWLFGMLSREASRQPVGENKGIDGLCGIKAKDVEMFLCLWHKRWRNVVRG